MKINNGDKYRSRRDEDKKGYKDKGKKSCYTSKEDTNDESDKSNKEEVLYVIIKDDSNEDDATALVSCVNKNDRWVIDSICSHHMTRDKSKFETFELYNGNSVRFGKDAPCLVKGKGSIKLTDKIICDNAYYIEGLNYNFLSVSQLNNSGCKVEFNQKIEVIDDASGELIGSGD